MFGYVSIYKPEMKVKDFEIYKAVYCGLCRYMGKNYGPLSKFCLSYDMTFVSLLQASLMPGCAGYEQKICRANPFKKCTYCKNDEDYHKLAAAASLALCNLKVSDNIKDSRLFKSFVFRFLRIFTKRWAKKAYMNFPELESVIEEYENSQDNAENSEECSLDMAAEPSAKAVSKILGMIQCEGKYKFVLERMGYCLGKWVYMCDAADDLVKDIEKERFNPIKKDVPKNENPLKYAERRLTPVMNNCFAECANYKELLEIKKYEDIINNIIYLGLRKRQEKIFTKETDR